MTEKNPTLKEIAKSIEDLASVTAGGFFRVEKRLDAHDQRFESIDQRFESIDQRFESIDQRFDAVDKRFDRIESEIKTNRVEISLGVRELKEEIERLDIRIDRLFKQTSDDISVLIDEQEKIKLRLKKLELKNSQS